MNRTFIIFILAMTSAVGVGALFYAFLESRIGVAARQRKRLQGVQASGAIAATTKKKPAGKTNRQLVQDALKDIDEKNASKKRGRTTLSHLLRQSGSSWSKTQYYILSFICGLVLVFVGFVMRLPMPALSLPAVFIVGALGLPRWFLLQKRKRRFKAFLLEFPNSIDVIVRGVKAGLPLHECLKIIAAEAKEPVCDEFRKVVENQSLGMPLTEALDVLCRDIPLPETNFFAISIAIQQQTGGNLSEVLDNLSGVLRSRKLMDAKIKAMAAEAKASAGIIGSLPPLVMAVVSVTSPDYMVPLFTTDTGNLLLVIAFGMMFFGIMVMRKMINFDY